MTNNDKVPELIKSEFDEFVREGLVLIDFHADWCMPCLMMAPVISELSEKFKGKIKFGKVNVDETQDIAQKFKIMAMPTFILFKDGEKIEQFVGAMPIEDLENKLEKFL